MKLSPAVTIMHTCGRGGALAGAAWLPLGCKDAGEARGLEGHTSAGRMEGCSLPAGLLVGVCWREGRC